MKERVKCIFCGARPAPYVDPKKHLWCEACKYRYDLIVWGMHHEWPYLTCYPYAIGNDEALWYTAALIGDEAYVRAALDAIALLESDEVI